MFGYEMCRDNINTADDILVIRNVNTRRMSRMLYEGFRIEVAIKEID
jgi:hypothetical protein